MVLRAALWAAAWALTSACRPVATPPTQAVPNRWQGRGRECVRPFLAHDSPYVPPPPRASHAHPAARAPDMDVRAPAPDFEGAALPLDGVPPDARRTVRAAELEALVAATLEEAHRSGRSPSVQFLATRQDLGMRLISLETQLSAVIFEAECTGELIEAMTFDLERRAKARELLLAVSSLVVGAAAAAASGIWDLAQSGSLGPAVLGLTGGVTGAALGGAAFVRRTERMRFEHPRNLLTPIVRGDDTDQLYPSFVFRLLTLPSADTGPSPRERLLREWDELIADAVPSQGRAAANVLLYGTGGAYDQDLLALRERLYDALESHLNALARDLELLDRYLVRVLEARR